MLYEYLILTVTPAHQHIHFEEESGANNSITNKNYDEVSFGNFASIFISNLLFLRHRRKRSLLHYF